MAFMKKVAIKFCGGCDPNYDRVEYWKCIRSAAGDRIEWIRVDDSNYEAVLVISGCQRACVEREIDGWRRQSTKCLPVSLGRKTVTGNPAIPGFARATRRYTRLKGGRYDCRCPLSFYARSDEGEGDREELMKKALETWPDPTGEGTLALMEDAGIDFTCICFVDNVDNELLTVEITQSLNKNIGEIAQKYPDRLAAFAGIDPRRPEAPDMMKQCFEEFGVRGLKYHPDSGYHPASPESYKLCEIAQDNNGVLLSHTGPLPPPSRSNLADATLLADLAVDFPDLKVIAAHMGQIMSWRPFAALATFQPNLYGDLAMWDAYAFGHYERFCRELRDLMDYAGAGKILFGTDGPIFNIVEPTKNWIRLMKDLPAKAPDGIKFTDEEINAILGDNAAAMLGL